MRQNIVPHSARPAEPQTAGGPRKINELVYFGTLETRKGIALFCDALDAIPAALAKKIQIVTFLGRESIVDGIPARSYLEKRAKRWPFPFQVISGHDANRTMEYLRQKNRLAVIPSLLENSPYRVLECLVAGVAFVASRVGGIPELIDPADASKVCFEPNTEALCATLCAALTDGLCPARAVVDARANEQAWLALHENSFGTAGAPAQPQPPVSDPVPSVASFPSETERAAIQALSINPTDAVALKLLARIHLKAGLHESAQEACQWILKHDSTDEEARQIIEESRGGIATLTQPLHFPLPENFSGQFAAS